MLEHIGVNGMKKLLLTASFLFLGTQASSGIFKGFIPSNVSQLHIEMSDSATEGCWTNISEVKRYAEDKLELEGFKIRRDKFEGYEDTHHFVVGINVNAQRNGDLCFGAIKINISKAIRVEALSSKNIIGYFSLGETGSIFSGQENVNRGALETIDQLMNEVKDPQW